MKKLIYFLFMMIFTNHLYGAIPYVDVLTAPNMLIQAAQLKDQQELTNENLSKIERAELLVLAQVKLANEYQNKIVKGLTEVSSLINDAFVVKDIYKSFERLASNTKKIKDFVVENPEFSVFALPAVNNFNYRLNNLTLEVTKILTPGEVNMMNAGQRRAALSDISVQSKLLASSAWSIHFSMEKAKRLGFWKAINPFRTWTNQDVRLMQDIIKRSRYLGV